MRKTSPIYSGRGPAAEKPPPWEPAGEPSPSLQRSRLRMPRFKPPDGPNALVLPTVLSLFVLFLFQALNPKPIAITQEDIDSAVLYTLESLPPGPSQEALVYPAIAPAIVRVSRHAEGAEGAEAEETGTGTGVVIVDTGVILTNFHVVAGQGSITVTFSDGLKSAASIIGLQPERDLAVLQAELVPDDLLPATLGSTRGLNVGDRVAAVGFPFGIGPSLSSGVISGLGRTHLSAGGGNPIVNLIQFDAAANPGNSGGPLVTMDGAVVGIVTAIYNPTGGRFFVGIGFAVPIEEAAGAYGESPF